MDAGESRRKLGEARELMVASGANGWLSSVPLDPATVEDAFRDDGEFEALRQGYFLCEVLRDYKDFVLAEAVETLRLIAARDVEDPVKAAEKTLEEIRHGREAA